MSHLELRQLPVPSPDEKGGGLGVGLATPPRKKKRCYRNCNDNNYTTTAWTGRLLFSGAHDACW